MFNGSMTLIRCAIRLGEWVESERGYGGWGGMDLEESALPSF